MSPARDHAHSPTQAALTAAGAQELIGISIALAAAPTGRVQEEIKVSHQRTAAVVAPGHAHMWLRLRLGLPIAAVDMALGGATTTGGHLLQLQLLLLLMLHLLLLLLLVAIVLL